MELANKLFKTNFMMSETLITWIILRFMRNETSKIAFKMGVLRMMTSFKALSGNEFRQFYQLSDHELILYMVRDVWQM